MKYPQFFLSDKSEAVTPCVGVWIEIELAQSANSVANAGHSLRGSVD